MTDFERYVLEEHVEDFNDGIISRRELLRRVTLITGSLAATVTVLEVLGCGSTPSGTPAQPVSTMNAYVVVVDTPFYAKVGASGAFRIHGMLPGRYEVAVWHEASSVRWVMSSKYCAYSL